MRVDVAVIGAGPAGSTLAALLARRGASVALVDRDAFPRDKLCGEFLSYDALPILDRLGILAQLDACNVPAIARCRIVGRTTTYDFDLPRPARGVSRRLLDDLLFRCATASGASGWSGWTATNIDANGVTLERNGEQTDLEARVVVGAWGRWGRFDAQLGRRFVRDRSHRNFGFKRHYRAASSAGGTIDLHSFGGGYLGVSPIEGGLTNICGLVHASRLAGLKGGWEAFVAAIRREERGLERLYAAHEPAQETFLSSEPVIFRSRSAVEGGVVMAGDAAGIIDPLTGNGMAMAIQSALLAAPSVLQMVAGKERSGLEMRYRRDHHRFFAPRIRWSRQVARLLSNPAVLDAAMRLVRYRRPGRFLLERTRADEAAVERLVSGWF
ncbi:MAG TPA: NAD(P)/FAD-dependent oxidoreductase [Thermoanaerobaculia bacterium]|nr:NAD(P)/FAD-dependent oxidoreductase [Thermoanaerobaculia bacterium]